jgi:hypothetical protein
MMHKKLVLQKNIMRVAVDKKKENVNIEGRRGNILRKVEGVCDLF